MQNIILHSYAGSRSIAKSLCKLAGAQVYFSFAQIRNQRAEEVIEFIPEDKILVETDSPHQLDMENLIANSDGELQKSSFFQNKNKSLDLNFLNDPSMVRITLKRMAKIRGTNWKNLAFQIYRNSLMATKLII